MTFSLGTISFAKAAWWGCHPMDDLMTQRRRYVPLTVFRSSIIALAASPKLNVKMYG